MDQVLRPSCQQRSTHTRAFLQAVYHQRNRLAALPVAYALFSTRWEWPGGPVLWIFAALICASGIAVRAWGRCHNGYGRRRGRELATSGPYALVRNPLYWGNTLIIASAIAASGLVWMLPFAVAWCFLVYHGVVLHEEERLRERYGSSYERYMEAVPRWVPRLERGPGRTDWREWLVATAGQLHLAVVLLLPLVKHLNLSGL